MDNPLTSIPPKRLMLIAGGGIGAGLLWRYMAGRRKGATPVATDAGGAPIDTSLLALGQNSAGNLSAAQPGNVNDATRDLGGSTFPIPVTYGVTRGMDGLDYYVDATGRIIGLVTTGVPHSPTTAAEAGNVPLPGETWSGSSWVPTSAAVGEAA